jgi:hypothetical protein
MTKAGRVPGKGGLFVLSKRCHASISMHRRWISASILPLQNSQVDHLHSMHDEAADTAE